MCFLFLFSYARACVVVRFNSRSSSRNKNCCVRETRSATFRQAGDFWIGHFEAQNTTFFLARAAHHSTGTFLTFRNTVFGFVTTTPRELFRFFFLAFFDFQFVALACAGKWSFPILPVFFPHFCSRSQALHPSERDALRCGVIRVHAVCVVCCTPRARARRELDDDDDNDNEAW